MQYKIETYLEMKEDGSKKIEVWENVETGEKTFKLPFPTIVPLPLGNGQAMPYVQEIPVDINATSVAEAFANWEQTLENLKTETTQEEPSKKIMLTDGSFA